MHVAVLPLLALLLHKHPQHVADDLNLYNHTTHQPSSIAYLQSTCLGALLRASSTTTLLKAVYRKTDSGLACISSLRVVDLAVPAAEGRGATADSN